MDDETYMEVERNCRYGHGPLARHPNTALIPNTPSWTAPAPGEAIPAPHTFVANIYRCTTCGYLELVDFNA